MKIEKTSQNLNFLELRNKIKNKKGRKRKQKSRKKKGQTEKNKRKPEWECVAFFSVLFTTQEVKMEESGHNTKLSQLVRAT